MFAGALASFGARALATHASQTGFSWSSIWITYVIVFLQNRECKYFDDDKGQVVTTEIVSNFVLGA